VAATCDALSITSLVARKLQEASFSLVRKGAGKPLLQLLDSCAFSPYKLCHFYLLISGDSRIKKVGVPLQSQGKSREANIKPILHGDFSLF